MSFFASLAPYHKMLLRQSAVLCVFHKGKYRFLLWYVYVRLCCYGCKDKYEIVLKYNF